MINLGDKNWGVKDSGLLAYKQVGSKYFNKDFDFTRASNGTYVDKNGVLQTAELYNLVSYSEDLIGYWSGSGSTFILDEDVISPNKTKNVKKTIVTSSGSFKGLVKNLGSSVANQTLTISAFIKKSTTDWAYFYNIGADGGNNGVWFNITNGTIGTISNAWSNVQIEDYGDGWYRCSATLTYGAVDADYIYILMTSADTSVIADDNDSIYIWGTQLVEGTEARDYQYTNGRVGIPRVDFSDGVGALLLEPQRSNLLLQSNSFDTTWATTNSSVTSGQDGVYGTNDAWLLSKSAASGRLYQNLSASGALTFSVYMKANASAWALIQVDGSPNYAYAYLDLQNGTIGSTSSANIIEGIEDIGNGWHRVFVSLNDVVTRVRIYPADGNGNVGGTSGSIYIQHAQLESGSYPTSIIEATTSAVTRIADVANNCGSEQDFNSEEGVLYLEASALEEGGVHRQIAITDGTFDNYVYLRYSLDGGRFQAYLKSGGGVNDSLSSVANVQTDNNKIALVYKASEFSMWLNGSKVSTTTPNAMPIGLNKLEFELVTSNPFYGKVRSLKYFPEALTDEQLQNLTT
jgi:hypothetical protein